MGFLEQFSSSFLAATGEQAAAKRTAQRKSADGVFVVLALCSERVDVGGVDVGIPIATEGLGAVLVTENPDSILVGGALGVILSPFYDV